MSKLQEALRSVEAPKIGTRELQQRQYKAANIQAASVTQTDYTKQLMGIAQGVAQYASNYDKQREATGIERKNQIMQQNLKPEQMRKLREEGILLYQDDIYAMRALDRTLGRQEAYAAESMIQQRIEQGYYKSRQEMEEERSRVLEDRMNSMGEAFGIDPKNRGFFEEGFASDMTERSFAIYNAIDKKVDEYNRNNSVVAIDNEVTELVKSGNSQHIVQVLQQRVNEGVIRTEADFKAHLVRGMKELAQQPQSVDALNAMADTEVSINGEKTTMRAHLGDEAVRTLVNQAANATLSNNWETQKWFMEKNSVLTAPDFSQPDAVEKALDTFRELDEFANLSQGEAATQARIEIQRAKAVFDQKHREWNDKQEKAITASQQQKVRLAILDEAVNGRLDGSLTHSLKLSAFTESEKTGKFETNDWNAYYDFKTGQIDSDDSLSPEQKAIKKLQLGVALKDIPDSGFGAHYAETFTRVSGEMAKYSAALSSGAEPPETPTLNQLMEFYKASPELFSQTFGPDFPAANQIAIAATMGVHPSVLLSGQKRLEDVRSMAPEQQAQIFKEFANWENNQGSNVYQTLGTEQRDALRALYLGMEGYDNTTKMSIIGEHLKNQYESVDGLKGVIPKSFLMSDPKDPKSVSIGKQRLNDKIVKQFGTAGNTSVYVIGDRLVVMNSLGSAPMFFTKEMLMSN